MAIFRVSNALEATFEGGADVDTIDAGLYAEGDDDSGYYPVAFASLLGGGGADEIKLASTSILASSVATVNGGAGADTIDVSISVTSFEPSTRLDVDGGDGDDAILVRLTSSSELTTSSPTDSVIRGGSGNDFIEAHLSSGYRTTNLVYGGDGDDHIIATQSDASEEGMITGTLAYGGDGNDLIELETTSGILDFHIRNDGQGGTGNDTITAKFSFYDIWNDYPSSAVNTLYGDEGNDRLTGNASGANGEPSVDAHSELYGGTGNDRLKVSGGTDNFLTGNQGDDTLLGSTGDDRMIGGQGDDYLKGYAGDDTFEFQSARNGERDRIDGFDLGGDVIDLSRIDANAFRGGNQSFDFDGTGDGGTGRVWLEDFGTKTVLHADTGKAVLDIVLLDGGTHASDYSASDFLL